MSASVTYAVVNLIVKLTLLVAIMNSHYCLEKSECNLMFFAADIDRRCIMTAEHDLYGGHDNMARGFAVSSRDQCEASCQHDSACLVSSYLELSQFGYCQFHTNLTGYQPRLGHGSSTATKVCLPGKLIF